MHKVPGLVHARRRLVDPAACGVRLGVELRTRAERLAHQSGVRLSVWIRHLVEEAVSKSSSRAPITTTPTSPAPLPRRPPSTSDNDDLDRAFKKEMEKLYDR